MTYQAFPTRRIVLRYCLEDNAEQWPLDEAVVFDGGISWTYTEALAQARRAANALYAAGVRQGDRVMVLLDNGPDYLRAWWGVMTLGATLAPVHTGAKGRFLDHLMQTLAPSAIIATGETLETLARAQDASLLPALRLTPADLHSDDAAVPPLERELAEWDVAVCLTTSGTTGLSKIVPVTYRHNILASQANVYDRGGRHGDAFLLNLPLFHGAALWMGSGCLAFGLKMVVRSAGFDDFWNVIRETGTTMAVLIGAMVPFLLGKPESPSDRDHNLKVLTTSPIPVEAAAFQRRFGFESYHTAYGSTEVPAALVLREGDPLAKGYMGRVRDGFQVKIVDSHDMEVPDGQPGEVVVRADHPWMMMTEYLGDPEATAKAWRNGWFHTGDTGRRENGMFFFVDRLKDAMRRRGENVSAIEVEAVVRDHPAVAKVAVVAVHDDESSEDEIKAWIVPEAGVSVDFAELLRFCVDNLPYYMVPRYFELIDELPLTQSQRVKKFELRERGNGASTWDRHTAGLKVTRAGLVETAPAS